MVFRAQDGRWSLILPEVYPQRRLKLNASRPTLHTILRPYNTCPIARASRTLQIAKARRDTAVQAGILQYDTGTRDCPRMMSCSMWRLERDLEMNSSFLSRGNGDSRSPGMVIRRWQLIIAYCAPWTCLSLAKRRSLHLWSLHDPPAQDP